MKGLGRYALQLLIFYLQEKEYEKGRVLFKEGDPLKYLYIVKEGTVELSTTVKINNSEKNQYSLDLLKSKQNFNVTDFQKLNKREILRKKVQDKKSVKLRMFATQDYFGDLELATKSKTREFKATVTIHKSLIYFIRIEKFLDIVKGLDYLPIIVQRRRNIDSLIRNSQNLTISESPEMLSRKSSEEQMKRKKETVVKFGQFCCQYAFMNGEQDIIRNTQPSYTKRNPFPKRNAVSAISIDSDLENRMKIFKPGNSTLSRKLVLMKKKKEESVMKSEGRSRPKSGNYYCSTLPGSMSNNELDFSEKMVLVKRICDPPLESRLARPLSVSTYIGKTPISHKYLAIHSKKKKMERPMSAAFENEIPLMQKSIPMLKTGRFERENFFSHTEV